MPNIIDYQEKNKREFTANMTNEEYIKYIDFCNKNFNKSKADTIERKSFSNHKISLKNVNKEKVTRSIVAAAIVSAAIFGCVHVHGKITHQNKVEKAIEFQKEEIALMLEKGNTDFTEDQLLGLCAMLGDERGVKLATGMDLYNWCKQNGYTEVGYISSSGEYAERYASMTVAKNYLEPKAIERMEQHTDKDGNFVFDKTFIKGGK